MDIFVMDIIHIEIRTNCHNKNFAFRLVLKETDENSEMAYSTHINSFDLNFYSPQFAEVLGSCRVLKILVTFFNIIATKRKGVLSQETVELGR